MKTLIFIIVLSGYLPEWCSSVSAYAKSGFAYEPFKIKMEASGEAHWALRHGFRHVNIEYRDNTLQIYCTGKKKLVGIGRPITVCDMPRDVLLRINESFQPCDIVSPMLFIDSKGRVYYYSCVRRFKKLIAVKVSVKCKVNVLQAITIN